jgi:hypothetical protein
LRCRTARTGCATEELFAPFPEEFPGGYQFLHEAWGGEIEEAAAVCQVFVFFADHDGAEEGEGVLELFELIAGHGVIGEVGVAVGHGDGSVADSLFVRHKCCWESRNWAVGRERRFYLGVGTGGTCRPMDGR